MVRMLIIAENTFREVIRDRIFYVLVFFAVCLIAVSKALGWISIEHDEKVIADFSLAGINLFALLITVFLGTTLVYKEVEKRTLYSVLSKDIRRWHFVLGKYVGLLGTAALCVAGMGVIFLVYLVLMGGTPSAAMLLALYGTLLELAVITSLSLFFSSLTSPILSAILTFAIFLAGHSLEVIRRFLQETRYEAKGLLVAYHLLPNLETFNFKNFVGAPFLPGADFLGLATLYALAWAFVLLGLTLVLYRRKDF